MSAIWTSQLLHSLTSLCNIPSSSHLHGFRVDSDLQGNKDLISLTVVFKKPFLHSPKYKSPSTIRHNQQRRQNWLNLKSTTTGVASQAGVVSSHSQIDLAVGSAPLLISSFPSNPVLSSSTASESKVVSNSIVPSGTSSGPSDSASIRETFVSVLETKGTTSSISTTNHPIHPNASSNVIPPSNRQSHPSPAPPASPTTSTSNTPALGRKRARSLTPLTQSPAFDSPGSLHSLEATTRSDSLYAQSPPPPPPMQSSVQPAQSTIQSEHTQQGVVVRGPSGADVPPPAPTPTTTTPATAPDSDATVALPPPPSSSTPAIVYGSLTHRHRMRLTDDQFNYTSATDPRFTTFIDLRYWEDIPTGLISDLIQLHVARKCDGMDKVFGAHTATWPLLELENLFDFADDRYE